jgi:hypothetical protein
MATVDQLTKAIRDTFKTYGLNVEVNTSRIESVDRVQIAATCFYEFDKNVQIKGLNAWIRSNIEIPITESPGIQEGHEKYEDAIQQLDREVKLLKGQIRELEVYKNYFDVAMQLNHGSK